MIKVGIVGALGYTGTELVRLIHSHPEFELTFVTSRREKDKKLSHLFSFLKSTKEGELKLIHPDDAKDMDVDIVFLAVPHKSAMEMAPIFLKNGSKVVDLSADFRLSDHTTYEKWYKTPHTQHQLLSESVYGLIEIYKEEIKRTKLVANPGCYPTSIILGLYPALKNRLIMLSPIIIDSKSGTSGAGRTAKLNILFSEVYDNFRPYSIGGVHRHTPEIEEQLSKISNSKIKVSFNPHLLPIQRGIISTMYVKIDPQYTFDDIYMAYKDFDKKNKWIRVYDKGEVVEARNVRGTMYCDISLCYDSRTDTLLIISCIDNICRGASGQAVANANLMCGLDMDMGLNNISLLP